MAAEHIMQILLANINLLTGIKCTFMALNEQVLDLSL